MRFNFFIYIGFFTLLIISCSSKKDVLYLQNSDLDVNYEYQFLEYRIKTDDILKIDVNSIEPNAALIFSNSSARHDVSSNKVSMLYNGYHVSTSGDINFPLIGVVKVVDLTIEELREKLYNLISDGGILINPFIDIKILNTHFTILGEVNAPGRYEYIKNNINILEAIGMAGDLTINGKRRDIKIIRNHDGKQLISSVDLTRSDFLKGNNFQVISGDIIIVNPNTSRVKSAGIIGNSGTLLSLLSFITTSIIVITNN